VSEFTIVSGAARSGQYIAGGLLLLLLGIVFLGLGSTVLSVVQGRPVSTLGDSRFHDSASTGAPILLFMALVLLFGVYIPPPLESLLREAAATIEVK
jgi:hydrogenase-4 component F